MKHIIISALLLASLGACKHESGTSATPSTNAEKVVFGSFFGECMSNCVKAYQVENSALQKDSTVAYNMLTWTYNFTGTSSITGTPFTNAKALLSSVPAELVTDNNKTFGCPDCRDQGGIYVAILKGGTWHRFRIDPDSTTDQSAGVIAYKQRVASLLAQL